MSYFDFLGRIFDWQVIGFTGSILLGVAFIVGGVVALTIGTDLIAWEFGWGWNLLYVPAVVGVALFGALFAMWLGVEVLP